MNILRHIILTASLLFCIAFAGAQTVDLPASLREISGLEALDEKHFVAINDGGNSADLFVIDQNGQVLRTVRVENATNEDWEDLASDGTYLYVGDIGNNLNKRRDLCVYKILLKDIATEDVVRAEKIAFSYREQTAFPPQKSEKRYDAEGMIFYQGKLWIFTKINDDPWSGNALIYQLSTTPGTYELSLFKSLYIGRSGWWKDAITAADEYNGKLYLMTYDRVMVYDIDELEAGQLGTYSFEESTQKESLLVLGEEWYIADEHQTFLGGGKLYHFPLSAIKKTKQK